jgi:hypothetical protein
MSSVLCKRGSDPQPQAPIEAFAQFLCGLSEGPRRPTDPQDETHPSIEQIKCADLSAGMLPLLLSIGKLCVQIEKKLHIFEEIEKSAKTTPDMSSDVLHAVDRWSPRLVP